MASEERKRTDTSASMIRWMCGIEVSVCSHALSVLIRMHVCVAAWLSGSTLVSINEVTVPGQASIGMGDCLWVGKPHWFVTSHSG